MGLLRRPHSASSPEQYRGQRELTVFATQLAADGSVSRSEEARILQSWIEFFAGGPTRIRRLRLWSRIPQRLLDSLVGQTQLEALTLKWGEYADLTVLSGLTELSSLTLGGAKKVVDLSPLLALKLTKLTVDQGFAVQELRPLGRLSSLRELSYGNGYPGNDKNVDVADLEWLRPLTGLRILGMPGTRLLAPDLSIFLELPNLVELNLPLRRAYRKQVFEYAEHSAVFARLARGYEGLDAFRARTKAATG